jgi:predicted kinase
MKNNFRKTVIINRAVPGSGKTSLARCITETLTQAGLSIANHSTDEFFMVGKCYCFDLRKLHGYHQRNLKDFRNSLRKGVDVVICDNTNIQPWQTAPYTDLARHFGYQIIFLNLTPRELWKHCKAQMVTPEKPDAHQVPEEKLAEFIRDFNIYAPLLNAAGSVDPERHRHFVWNNEKLCPEAVGPARHFDLDHIVTVHPDEYHAAKKEIGRHFLSLIGKD